MFESGELAPKNGEVCIKNIQLLDGKMIFGKVVKDSNTKPLFSIGTNVYFSSEDVLDKKYEGITCYYYVHASDIKSDFDIVKSFQLKDEMKDYDKWHKTLNYSMLFNALLLACIAIMLKIGEFNV